MPDMRARLRSALDDARGGGRPLAAPASRSRTSPRELTRSYRARARTNPGGLGAAEREELHELRKRVVIHRYQMELVEPLWPRFGKMWTAEAQRLRDRLGQVSGSAGAAAFAGPHQPLAPWRSRLAPAIAARKAAHGAAAERLAARLFVDKPDALRRRLDAMWRVGK